MMTEADQNLENGMEDLSDDKTAVWPSPGEKLRKIREERGLSHHRVADALHMTAHYVKSLESDQYDKLPGKTFVKGYFKAYARLLEADVDEIMRCYENFVVALEESQESVAEEIRARKVYDQNIRWMICAAVIIIVVVGVSWWMSRQPQNTAEVDENRTRSTAVVEVQSITEPENTSANTQVSENVLGFADVQEPVTAEALIAKLEEKPGEKAGLQNLAEPEELQNIEKEDDEGVVAVMFEESSGALLSESGSDAAEKISEDKMQESSPATQTSISAIVDTTESQSPSAIPQDYTVTRFDDHREVNVESEGEDLLEIRFSGSSWIEVDNGDNTRLYHDMLSMGDDLKIRGKAPFNILIGDAVQVEMTFNSQQVDVVSRMREDNSARLLLESQAR